MHQPAPEPGAAQGPLGPLLGGLPSGFHHERPPGPHLPLQRAGTLPGFGRSRPGVVQQPAHPRIPGPHGAGGRRGRGPADQPLPLGPHAAATPGQLRVLPLREAPRAAAQRRRTALPRRQPLAGHPIAGADQAPGPARHQGLEGRRVPAGLHLDQRPRRIAPAPPPRQPAGRAPAGLIHAVARRPPGPRCARLRHRGAGLRAPLDRALGGSPAELAPQARRPKRLHRAATAPPRARQLPDERRPPGALPGRRCRGPLRRRDLAPVGTVRLLQHAMPPAPLERGPLAHLVGLVGPGGRPLGLPTGAGRGLDRQDLRGGHQRGPMARGPGLGARRAVAARTRGPFLVWRIAGGRTSGLVGTRRPAGFQLRHSRRQRLQPPWRLRDEGAELGDPVRHDAGPLLPGGRVQRQPVWQRQSVGHSSRPWLRHGPTAGASAAVALAKNPANDQCLVKGIPLGVILTGHPLNNYNQFREQTMADDSTQPPEAPTWSWKVFGIWCLVFGLIYIPWVYQFQRTRPDQEEFILPTLIGIPFGVAFYYGLYILVRRWLYRISRGQVKAETLSEKAESLKEELDKDFFTNLIRINFKYLDKYYLQTQEQADKSFLLNLMASIVGFGIIIAGIVLMFFDKTNPAYVTSAAGVT